MMEVKVQPLVSVIIPVYNVEKYLDRCIKSVVKQTYSEIEIFIVDDGSKDNSSKICDEWANNDKRITVIHKNNDGAGMARNSGLDAANGDYVCFIDSDDWVEPNMIEGAVNAAINHHADLVCYGMFFDDQKGNIVFSRHPVLHNITYMGTQVQSTFLPDYIASRPGGNGPIMTVWSCLINRKIIEKNLWRFVSERDIFSEDVYSMLDLCAFVKSVCVIPDLFYHYCYNESSFTHTYREDRFPKIKIFYQKCLELCEIHGYGDDVKDRLKKPFLDFTVAAMKQIYESTLSKDEKRKELESICLDDTLQRVIRSASEDYMTIKTKILWRLVCKRMLGLVSICLQLSTNRRY